MEKIYIIELITGDYDISDYPIGFVEDEEIAKNLIIHLNKLNEIAKSILENLYNYVNNVIQPSVEKEEMEKFPVIPKWPAGLSEKEITKEMRDERTNLSKLQIEIQERNRVKWERWDKQVKILTEEHINSLGLEPDVYKMLKWKKNESISGFSYHMIEKWNGLQLNKIEI